MKRLRWYDFLTINLFWLGLNIRNTAVGSVFTPYLVALFVPENQRNTALGFISTAGLIIAMLVQPAAGLLSDRSTSRFGRRRPFIFVGTLFDLLFLTALALSGNFWMLLVATLLIQFSANVSHGPLQGLIPDLVPEAQRGRASAIKAVMELIPIVLVGFTIAQAVGGLAGLVAWPFLGRATALAVVVGLGGVVTMVVAVIAGVWSGALVTLGQDARRQSGFTWWVVNRLLFLAAATSFQGFLPFFLMYAFRVSAEEAASMNGTLMTIIGLFIMLAAFAGGWVSDRFGRRMTVGVSGVISAVGAALALTVIWLPNLTIIYAAGVIIGLGAGLFMTANWALGTDLVPAEEAGRYLGISNLAGAGAGMIGKGIGGPMADYLNGYLPGLGYFAIFASYAILFLASAVSLKWIRRSGA